MAYVLLHLIRCNEGLVGRSDSNSHVQTAVSARRRKAWALALGLAVGGGVNGGLAFAETAEAAPPKAVNKITSAAVQVGALTCAARVQQVTSFLGVTDATPVSLRPPISPANQSSVSISMALEVDGATALAFADFFPASLGCKASYSITLNLPQPCDEVRASRYADLGEGSSLTDGITELRGANALRISFVGVGETCTVIKSQTLD